MYYLNKVEVYDYMRFDIINFDDPGVAPLAVPSLLNLRHIYFFR